MMLNERDRRALKMGAIGLGIILCYRYVIDPAVTSYNDLCRAHRRLATQIAQAVYETDKAEHNAKLVAEWEEEKGPLSAPKPYDEQITTVSNKIVEAGKKSGIKLKDTTPRTATPWPDDRRLQMAVIQISAECDWEKMFKFIGALHRIDGVLSVESMNVTGDAKKGGKITLQMTVSVMVAADEGGSMT